MEEQLVSYETAVLAKKKGFDWKVTSHFKDDEIIHGRALYNMNCKEE